MEESKLISALAFDRRSYDQISAILDPEVDFSDSCVPLVRAIADYYDNDKNAERVDLSLISDHLNHDYPKLVTVHKELLSRLDSSLSVPNILQHFRRQKEKSASQHLLVALTENNTDEVTKWMERLQHYRAMVDADEAGNVFVDAGIDDVLSVFEADNRIRIHPPSLNDVLNGGLVPGTVTGIYAPTEVGKSMLSINIAAGMLFDGHKVLYCGNEDPAKSMLSRFYARLSGMPLEDMLSNREEARRLATERGYGNLFFYEMSPGSIFDIKRMVEKYEPKVLIVDQMANMDTRAAFSKVEKNEFLATKIRSLTKDLNLVTIIIHQASDSAYGKLHLDKNDMYYSNVGVQGQMDVMIGLGMDEAYHEQNKRMVCFTKNKLTSKHAAVTVEVVPEISKVSDLGRGG